MSDVNKELIAKLDSYKDEMVELQRDLTAIPAMSPEYEEGEGEMKKAVFLEDYIKKLGLTDIQHYDAEDERVDGGKRPNFVVKLKGKDSSRKFWIMAHIDVVPPGDLDQWKGDPWTMRVDGDIMTGRGVEDNQQSLVSGIFAMKALLDLGIEPAYDTYLIVVADEETGSEYGISHILHNHDLFGKDDLIVVPDAGEPDATMIEVAEKSIVWMRFETTGKQCHGSTPEQGINAHKAAAHLVVALEELYEKFSDNDPVYEPPISTFEPTMKLANVGNINTIPGSDVVCYDCRILPQYDTDDVLKFVKEKANAIEKKFGVTIEITTPQLAKAAPPTPNDAEIVKLLQKSIKEIYDVNAVPMGIGGGTVAAHFREMGLNVAVWSKILDTCHQPEEQARISSMVDDSKVFVLTMI